MIARLAFLIGIVVVPGVLLWLGHRLRDRTLRQRRVFWGAVIGHSAALIIALLALHWPPVMWGSGVRGLLALWLMLLGAAAGAVVGAVRSGGSVRFVRSAASGPPSGPGTINTERPDRE